MYDKIMVPVDLSHRDALQKGIKTAADIARANDATITFVGITTAEPSAAGHTPDEFKQKLADFAKEQAEQHGVQIDSESRVSHDPAIAIPIHYGTFPPLTGTPEQFVDALGDSPVEVLIMTPGSSRTFGN